MGGQGKEAAGRAEVVQGLQAGQPTHTCFTSKFVDAAAISCTGRVLHHWSHMVRLSEVSLKLHVSLVEMYQTSFVCVRNSKSIDDMQRQANRQFPIKLYTVVLMIITTLSLSGLWLNIVTGPVQNCIWQALAWRQWAAGICWQPSHSAAEGV